MVQVKLWTKEETETLKKLYATTPLATLKKMLNKSKNAINGKASRLGLHKGTDGSWKKYDRKKAMILLEQGLTYRDVASKLGLHPETLRKQLHRDGLFKVRGLSNVSGITGERLAEQYFARKRWSTEKQKHPSAIDFLRNDGVGINVKHGHQCAIQLSNLERLDVGALIIFFAATGVVYTLRLEAIE